MDPKPAAVLHLEDSDLDAALIRDRLESAATPLAIDRAAERSSYLAALATRRYDLTDAFPALIA